MTTGGDGATYTADMDRGATREQTAEIQRLFDDIGLDVRVTASYTVKSTAGDVVEAVLWLGGAGSRMRTSARRAASARRSAATLATTKPSASWTGLSGSGVCAGGR